MALDGVGLEGIADYINQNIFHYMDKKTLITKQKLSGIFQDPFYAGLYLYGTEIVDLRKVDTLFEPMVTEVDFLQLRRLLKDAYSFRRREIKVQLFSKMVYCGFCNHATSPGIPRSSGKSKNRYLTLRCSYKNCPSRHDKTIKKGVRGKVLVDYIVNFLNSGLEVDKKAYETYLNEAQEVLVEDRTNLVQEHKTASRQITDIKARIELKEDALANAKGKLIDKLNKTIEALEGEKEKLETREKKD